VIGDYPDLLYFFRKKLDILNMVLSFIGIGKVGSALASTLASKGHQVIIANHNPESVSIAKALEKNPEFNLMPVQSAIDKADVVFLTTPFQQAAEALKGLRFNGKILIDCTNPVGPGLKHGLDSQKSGSEFIRELIPDARVVKAFTIYGFENFDNPKMERYPVKPVMLIAGDELDAKTVVKTIVSDTGFEPLDTGALSQALHLEHMTLLWVKMVRMGGHSPMMKWACLE
jgi:predicted dinucleotide-binding enzyme